MRQRLTAKTAIVTGGAGGIGEAIAAAYVKEGAKVILADSNKSVGKTAAEKVGAMFCHLDITDADSITDALHFTKDHLGSPDILVNNAAVFDMAPIVEITRASYNKIFAVNVEGLLFMLQETAREMIKTGKGGKIINISSQAGRRGEPLVAVYCASKAAVISLTQSAGLDLIKHKINVNGIAPGVVDTPMWDQVDALFAKYEKRRPGEKKKLVGEEVPYGRMGKPDDLVGAAIFLASHESDYVVAQTFNVDGGNRLS